MSKKSLRKEIDRLREESKSIISDKSTSKEVKLFIKSMLAVLSVVLTLFLEKRTTKNSSNSGIPPSKDPESKGNRNKGKRNNGGKLGKRLDNSKDTETSTTTSPSNCHECGENLKKVDVKKTETRKKIDIVYEICTHSVTSETKECPKCGAENNGLFPDGMEGPVQYGNGIKASVINFIIVQMISLKRVGEHYMGLVGCFISPATMLKYISNLGESLKKWEESAIKQIIEAPFMHVDETSLKVKKKNHWIHTYSSGDITLQFVHPARGLEATEDIGILDKYGGVMIHDCWSPYFTYDNIIHALCLAHLLRELKFIEESSGFRWATNLKKLLQEAITRVNRRKSKILTKKEYATLQRRYRNILTRALSELPPFPEKTGKRGRPKHTDAQNLWLRLQEYESAVLLFAKRKDIDPTNNRAERDLRMNKVKSKVSGCFRTLRMAQHFCRITSYVKTMRNKGYSSLEAISLALNGKIPA